jgi:hypothetical protein
MLRKSILLLRNIIVSAHLPLDLVLNIREVHLQHQVLESLSLHLSSQVVLLLEGTTPLQLLGLLVRLAYFREHGPLDVIVILVACPGSDLSAAGERLDTRHHSAFVNRLLLDQLQVVRDVLLHLLCHAHLGLLLLQQR